LVSPNLKVSDVLGNPFQLFQSSSLKAGIQARDPSKELSAEIAPQKTFFPTDSHPISEENRFQIRDWKEWILFLSEDLMRLYLSQAA